MADESVVFEEHVTPAQSPLVAVNFQRDTRRKEKYLEAEPKALGITQMGLSVFIIICVSVFLSQELSTVATDVPFFIASLLVMVAGSVAVAAQNLHLPTLKACLGMQIVASGASTFNIICTLVKMEDLLFYCWHPDFDDHTNHYEEMCHVIFSIHNHFYAGGLLVHLCLLAISVTLTTFCCKVVNCCGPAPKMPVITIQTPAVQQ